MQIMTRKVLPMVQRGHRLYVYAVPLGTAVGFLTQTPESWV